MQDDPGIHVIEHALVVDLLQDEDSRVCGVTLHVLATGGLGQIYDATTNPSHAPATAISTGRPIRGGIAPLR